MKMHDTKKASGSMPWCVCVMMGFLWIGFPAQAFQEFVNPSISDLAGGLHFRIQGAYNKVRFGGEDGPVALMYEVIEVTEDGVVFYLNQATGTIPPGLVAGETSLEGFRSSVLFDFYSDVGQWESIEETFLYVDSPLVDSMEPTMFSIGPDNRIVTLEGAGFPTKRGVEVWVGDVQAELVLQSIGTDFRRRRGELIQFRPPPFPGGEYPLTVDVRVVTVGGGETVLEDAFTYDQLAPEVIIFPLASSTRAWRPMFNLLIGLENLHEQSGYRVFFNDLEMEIYCVGVDCFRSNMEPLGIRVPPHPPGYIDVTVVGPDGGETTLEDAYRFTRTSPLHSADRNGDGVVSLSELLRVVQFYNEGGYRCAPEGVTTEDGFVPGPGAIPEDCRPHDSDLIDWDWQVDLSELLETIQLYNFGPYTLCEDEVFFCPAE